MKKHYVALPNTYKEKGSSSDSKGKGQVLMENSNSSMDGFLTQVPHITWVLQKDIFLH